MVGALASQRTWSEQELEVLNRAVTRQVLYALAWRAARRIEPTALIACLRGLECAVRATSGARQTVQLLASGRRLLGDHENLSRP